MKVFLDQAELPVPRPSLAAALDAARSAAGRAGRVIIEVKLDGLPVADAQLDNPSDLPLDADRLDFLTTDPRALVRTTLLDVADALTQSRDQQLAAADALQAGDFKDAFAKLSETVNIWVSVQRVATEGPALLAMSLDDVNARLGGNGRRFSSAIDNLTTALTQLRTSLSAQDWSTLADLLSGELDALAGEWDTLLRSLADHLAPKP